MKQKIKPFKPADFERAFSGPPIPPPANPAESKESGENSPGSLFLLIALLILFVGVVSWALIASNSKTEKIIKQEAEVNSKSNNDLVPLDETNLKPVNNQNENSKHPENS